MRLRVMLHRLREVCRLRMVRRLREVGRLTGDRPFRADSPNMPNIVRSPPAVPPPAVALALAAAPFGAASRAPGAEVCGSDAHDWAWLAVGLSA